MLEVAAQQLGLVARMRLQEAPQIRRVVPVCRQLPLHHPLEDAEMEELVRAVGVVLEAVPQHCVQKGRRFCGPHGRRQQLRQHRGAGSAGSGVLREQSAAGGEAQTGAAPAAGWRGEAGVAAALPGEHEEVLEHLQDHLVALQARVVQLLGARAGGILRPQRLVVRVAGPRDTGTERHQTLASPHGSQTPSGLRQVQARGVSLESPQRPLHEVAPPGHVRGADRTAGLEEVGADHLQQLVRLLDLQIHGAEEPGAPRVQLPASDDAASHELLQHPPGLRLADEVPEGELREAHEGVRWASGGAQILRARGDQLQKRQRLHGRADERREAGDDGGAGALLGHAAVLLHEVVLATLEDSTQLHELAVHEGALLFGPSALPP
mmetsp:Transcript_93317/g.301904  ORF Transcript_93317/g.301904 Transcript_93317/m.301904 type:complete len:379 (-) Transcript_93317:2472-3608(-)